MTNERGYSSRPFFPQVESALHYYHTEGFDIPNAHRYSSDLSTSRFRAFRQ